MLEPIQLSNITINNRLIMPPMCMYLAKEDGMVTDWHQVHYASRAVGGVGLIIVEATAVCPEGRITDQDLGIWSDDHIAFLKELTDHMHALGSKIGLQLNHAGRKSKSKIIPHLSVTEESFSDDYIKPQALNESGIQRIIEAFKQAASRANEAGFDMIEIHNAHGYLLHLFLSPLTNRREDDWGGSRDKRMALLTQIIREIQTVWPKKKPIGVRISATDYVKEGLSKDDIIVLSKHLESLGIALIDVSTGGSISTLIHTYPGYQIEYAEIIKQHVSIAVAGGGLLSHPDHVDDILENERSDMVYLGRELLRNPYWLHDYARKRNQIDTVIPSSYQRAY